MMCFRDITFCRSYMSCKDGHDCPRALTPKVIQAAHKWWGNKHAPISERTLFDACYIPLEIKDETITSRDGSSVLPTEHP